MGAGNTPVAVTIGVGPVLSNFQGILTGVPPILPTDKDDTAA